MAKNKQKQVKSKPVQPVVEKPLRAIKDVEVDYGNTCAQIGDKVFKANSLQANTQATLTQLNKEISELQTICKELDEEVKRIFQANAAAAKPVPKAGGNEASQSN